MSRSVFRDALVPRPVPTGLSAITQLHHFAIVTYAVEPERLRPLVHPRFELDTIRLEERSCALLSVVPFLDVDFTSAIYPFPRFSMGQTNYRIYVTDRETGERAVWFLGTVLDSWTVLLPRVLWKLPWHAGTIGFSCQYDAEAGCYSQYWMKTQSDWASAELELEQHPGMALELPGYEDLESGLVHLTHPLVGYYFRRDRTLGSYRVWHDRLDVKPARLLKARFELLERMKLVHHEDQERPHSVLLLPETEFTVYLPPRRIDGS